MDADREIIVQENLERMTSEARSLKEYARGIVRQNRSVEVGRRHYAGAVGFSYDSKGKISPLWGMHIKTDHYGQFLYDMNADGDPVPETFTCDPETDPSTCEVIATTFKQYKDLDRVGLLGQSKPLTENEKLLLHASRILRIQRNQASASQQ